LVLTSRLEEWSHSEGKDTNVSGRWSSSGSNEKLDTSVKDGSSSVGTFIGHGSIDRSISSKRIRNLNVSISISKIVSSLGTDVEMRELG
jgi:hypothetical protein